MESPSTPGLISPPSSTTTTTATPRSRSKRNTSTNTKRYPPLVGIIKFQGGSVLLGDKFVQQDLWFDSGLKGTKEGRPDEGLLYHADGSAQIISAQTRFWEAGRAKDYSAHMIFDISNLLAIPGYIDIQTNGAFGLDYTSPPIFDLENNIETTAIVLSSPPQVGPHDFKDSASNPADGAQPPGTILTTNAAELQPKPNNKKVSLHLENKEEYQLSKKKQRWDIKSTKPIGIFTPTLSRSSSHHSRSGVSCTGGPDIGTMPLGSFVPESPTPSIASSISVTISSEWLQNIETPLSDLLGSNIDHIIEESVEENLNPGQVLVQVYPQHLHPNKAKTFLNAYSDHDTMLDIYGDYPGPAITSPPLPDLPLPSNSASMSSIDRSHFKGCPKDQLSLGRSFDLENTPTTSTSLGKAPQLAFPFKPRSLLSSLIGPEPPTLEKLRQLLYARDRDMLYVNERIPRYGVTSICPTIISSDQATYASTGTRIIEYMLAVEQARAQGLIVRQCNMLGLHLEGPFISVPGAHNQDVLGPPTSPEHAANIYNGDTLFPFTSIVTMAPEMGGGLEVVRHLADLGIVVSMGHSGATIEQAKSGVNHGATLITHMFNAMRGFHHRDPGLMGLMGAPNPYNVHFSLIADGYHAHPYSVNIAHSASPDKLVLVTDSMAAMGLPDGQYKLGTQDVTMDNRKAVLTNSPNSLAGAVVPLDQCVRNFIKFTRCEPEVAILAATRSPAELLGIYPRKGSLLPGADADIVLLDPETLEVVATIINGQLSYVRDDTFPVGTGASCRKAYNVIHFDEDDDFDEELELSII